VLDAVVLAMWPGLGLGGSEGEDGTAAGPVVGGPGEESSMMATRWRRWRWRWRGCVFLG
jgi:hypothetical protein